MTRTDILNDHETLDSILRYVVGQDRECGCRDIRSALSLNMTDQKLRLLMGFLCSDEKANKIPVRGIGNDPDHFCISSNDVSWVFLSNGGYMKEYLESVERMKKEAEDQKIASGKLRDDAKISKWQVRAYWPMFVLSIWGAVTGTVALSLRLEERYYRPLQEQSEQTRPEKVGVSASSNVQTISRPHVLDSDTVNRKMIE